MERELAHHECLASGFGQGEIHLTRGITEKPELVRRIEQMTPMGRLAEPEEIVGAVLFLASRASAMVTGHTLAIEGGFLAQ